MKKLEIQRANEILWPFLKCLSERCREEFIRRFNIKEPLEIEENPEELERIMRQKPHRPGRVG